MNQLMNDEFVVRAVGSTNVIKKILDDFRVAEIIDSVVPTNPNKWKISPGTHVEAMIINVLRERRPLYKVEEAMAKVDLPLLFGQDIKAEHFNDDALGRTLDVLAMTNLDQLFCSIAVSAAVSKGVAINRLHADTTSVSVYGDYQKEDDLVNITRGHSKQRRPDLKQFMYGMMVNAEGYPVYGNVLDGNTSDKTWNGNMVRGMDALVRYLPSDLVYIADSALVTKENLKAIKGQNLQFISRLPANFNLLDQLVEHAWTEDKWTQIGTMNADGKGSSYKLCSFLEDIEGTEYRFVVVSSSSMDARKEKKLQRTIVKEQAEMNKGLKELAKQAFFCEPDALAALEQFQDKWSTALSTLELNIKETTQIIRGRGRPKKDACLPTKTTYSIEGKVIAPNDTILKELREKMACFVLITNIPEEAMSHKQILEEYKGQSSIEKRFRFLKDPLFVDSIYLKNQDRVYALGFIFLFALLIACYIESTVRRELTTREQFLTVPGNRKQQKPTIASLLEMLNNIQIVILYSRGNFKRHLSADINPDILRIIEFLGYDKSIYLKN